MKKKTDSSELSGDEEKKLPRYFRFEKKFKAETFPNCFGDRWKKISASVTSFNEFDILMAMRQLATGQVANCA